MVIVLFLFIYLNPLLKCTVKIEKGIKRYANMEPKIIK